MQWNTSTYTPTAGIHNIFPKRAFGQAERPRHAQLHRDDNGHLDVPSQKMIMEMTPPTVTINFIMCDLTWENGPIRQIPGSHTLQQHPPPPGDEPDWMKHSTLVGATAGSGVFQR